MSNQKRLLEIKKSILYALDHFSSREKLNTVVQVEEHKGTYSTMVLLFDSEGLLLMDEVYMGYNPDGRKAIKEADKLHAFLTQEFQGYNVDIYESIRVISV